MPYTFSIARVSAFERIKTLKGSFIYAKIRTKQLPTNVRDSIFQNCVFQLSATLEDYLRDLTVAWFDNMFRLKALNKSIPPLTRALIIAKLNEDAMLRYISLGDENDLAVRVMLNMEAFSLMDENRTMPDLKYGDIVVKDKKFPSKRNIESLFRRFGMPKIFSRLKTRTKSNADLALQSFIDIRNALAHESPPSITDEDVGRYFSEVTSWIEAIDREFYSHVVKKSGAAFWK